jgi:hypothetical protein
VGGIKGRRQRYRYEIAGGPNIAPAREVGLAPVFWNVSKAWRQHPCHCEKAEPTKQNISRSTARAQHDRGHRAPRNDTPPSLLRGSDGRPATRPSVIECSEKID